ncbi:MAG: hypothetical protein F6K42_14115 [Leptolyngbya sp. SIO1D8]|nr:hypothetical protein [Leptolyngbya sp. SIO1D8]
MVSQLPKHTRPAPVVTWERLPDDYGLPDDPVENIQQPLLAAALTDALGEANWIQPEMLIASNFGLVASVNRETVVKAPDWLVVPRVNPVAEGIIRRSYTPNLEGDPVALVMEFLSNTETGEYSLRPVYPYGKLYFYEQILKVPTYAIFDPATVTLEVRQLQDDKYVIAQPDPQNRIWIDNMGLFLGVWHGTRLGTTTNWLRWWDETGNLLLWSSERAEQAQQQAEQERQRAEQAQQRAEQLAARLREMGVDPDTL